MKKIILTNRLSKSIKKVANTLQGVHLYRAQCNTPILLDATNSIVIRWGSTQPIITDPTSVVYDNTKCALKVHCRKILRQHNIPIPKTYLTTEDMTQARFPLIGRPTYHTFGKQFYICNKPSEIQEAINKGAAYFSEFYPKTREFRVHCFMGKILAVMEKPKPKENIMQWNRAINGKPFHLVPIDQWDFTICKVAVDATNVLGVDYSGVDILAFPEETTLPQAVVCELNDTPVLGSSDHVLERYTKAFQWLFASDERRPQWHCDTSRRDPTLFAIQDF